MRSWSWLVCLAACAGNPPTFPATARLVAGGDAAAAAPADYAAVLQLLLAPGAAHFNPRWPGYLAVFQSYQHGDVIADEALWRLRVLFETPLPPMVPPF